MNVEVESEYDEPGSSKWLREDIGKLIFSRDETYFKELFSDHISDKMIVNLYMICASMIDRIGSEIRGTNIITIQNRWFWRYYIKFTKKCLDPS
jgi:hypothetical protein